MSQPVFPYSEPDYPEIKFVGRVQDLADFTQMLQSPAGQEWILFLYGAGGMGKTQLLKRFIEIARDFKHGGRRFILQGGEGIIDLYWTEHRREETLLRNLALGLAPERFQEFFTAFQDYENHLTGKMGDQELIARKLDSVRQAFLSCYARLDAERIVLFFDTAEQASDAALRFFSETLTEMHRLRPETFVVIAGRPEAQTRILPVFPENACISKEIAGLSEQEISDYLRLEGYSFSDTALIGRLRSRIEGRPIRVALVIDWLREGNTINDLLESDTDREFQESLVLRIAQLTYPQDETILAMALFQRRFDEDMLQVILDNIDRANAIRQLEDLSRFSFIKYHPPLLAEGQGVCLVHDEVRDLINACVWPAVDLVGTRRRQWIEKVIEGYYKPRLAREQSRIQARTLQEEQLYYLLRINLSEGFKLYEQLAKQAEDERGSATEHLEILNEEMETYREQLDGRMESVLAVNWSIALPYLVQSTQPEKLSQIEKLINSKEMSIAQQAELRYRLAQAYLRGGNLDHLIELCALEDSQPGQPAGEWYTWFSEQVNCSDRTPEELRPVLLDFGRLLTTVGAAYRAQNRMSRTVACYRRAIEVFENAGEAQAEIANVQNNLGYVYSRLGWNDKALTECQNSLEIRQRLDQIDQLGYSYNVIGMIRVEQLLVDQAETNFKQALRCFDVSGSNEGRGLVLIAFGRMKRQIGEYKEQMVGEAPDGDREEYKDAERMFSQAIAIFRSQRNLPNLVEALNEMGTLLRQRQHWEEAVQYYLESLQLAIRLKNQYRAIDNRVDLGILYFRNGDFATALGYAKQAAEEARKLKAYYLLSKSQQTVASILISAEKYEEAYQAAADSAAGILRLDPDRPVASATKREMEYERVLKWLQKSILLCLPDQATVNQAIEYLLERWNTELVDPDGQKKLVDEFPGFVDAMKRVRRDYRFLREKKVIIS